MNNLKYTSCKMFTDIVEIATFTLELLEIKKIQKNKAMQVYDVYRELDRLLDRARLVISYISRDIDHSDIHTSHGSGEKKWIWFCNKQIREYEDVKYSLFCKLAKLDFAGMVNNNGILAQNFYSKSINCKINEYTKVTHIDNELNLVLYSFNFIQDKSCPKMRSFEELFIQSVIDISEDGSKKTLIQGSKLDLLKIDKTIEKLEEFMLNNFSIKNLLVQN